MSNFTYCYGLIRFKTLAYCSLFSGTFLSNGLMASVEFRREFLGGATFTRGDILRY